MSRRSILVDGDVRTVAFVEPPPAAQRPWAVASGRAQDEISESPVASLLRVNVVQRAIGVNYGDDGAFCLVARPWLRFPPLLAAAYDVQATVRAEGYAPLDIELNVPSAQRTIAAPAPVAGATVLTLNDTTALEAGQLLLIGPANAPAERRRVDNLGPGAQQVTLASGLANARAVGDPVVADAWTPVDLGVLGLRREPVVIRGRAVRRDASAGIDVPVAGATIAVTDFWWTLGAVRLQQPGVMTQPNPALRAFALGISPGLYASRPVPGGQLASIALAPAAIEHLLLGDAAAGDARIRVSNRAPLAAGALLRVDPDAGDDAETLEIASVSGYGPPDQPGDVQLRFALRRDHRSGVRVLLLNAGAVAAPKTLRRAAAPGDRCVFVDDASGIAAGTSVRVSGGTAADEEQVAAPLTASSDAQGYFRLPPLQRIAALRLRASAAALPAFDFRFEPDLAARENWLDVVFA
ncbi:MAG: hypothetical protein ACM3SO_18805 [Betaproteobacteria bacterium]